MLDRRSVGIGLGAVLAWPPIARSQPKGKIGYIHPVTVDPSHVTFRFLKKRWQELGYREGETVLPRSGENNPSLIAKLVNDLADQGAAALIVVGAEAVRAAAKATATVPIVAVDLETDPVKTGLIASYARPGANVTGLFLDLPSLAAKWIELMRTAVPDVERIAFAWQPSTGTAQLEVGLAAARDAGIPAIVKELTRPTISTPP